MYRYGIICLDAHMLICLHPEDATSGLKHVEDIIKIRILV